MTGPLQFPRNADQQAHIDRCRAWAWRGIIVAMVAFWSIVGYAIWSALT